MMIVFSFELERERIYALLTPHAWAGAARVVGEPAEQTPAGFRNHARRDQILRYMTDSSGTPTARTILPSKKCLQCKKCS
ncbi:MAG: hypothetical protein WBQ94_17435, partial [Terracidiphilus sp.]